MKKNALWFLVLLPITTFFWCAQSANASMTAVTSDIITATTWKKENSPYVVDHRIYIKAPLIIEPGVIVKLYDANGISDNYNTFLSIQSDLTAVGTADEKIVFTSFHDDSRGGDVDGDGSVTIPKVGDWGGIIIYDNSAKVTLDNIFLSYTDIGIKYHSVYKSFYKSLTVKNSEIKNNGVAFDFRNVMPVIEGNIISNNKTGIATFSDLGGRPISINNNSIFDNSIGIDARNPFGPYCTDVDATYNWWGDTSGPYFDGSNYAKSNLEGKGNRIWGFCVKFVPWFRRSPEVKRDPIILVPGVGASINPDVMIGSILNDNWTMFDRTYDGLIKAIRSAGYIKDKDFFIAYYDWRKPNAESAENFLKPVIAKALALNPVGQVNIIAHSMGGLVARSYVQNSQSDDVNNLILVATPSRGSSDTYSLWEGGRVPDNWEGRTAMAVYIKYMELKNLSFNSYKVVHQFIPSLKDLLPTYSYLHQAGSSQDLKNYLGMNEKNDFLIGLNAGIADLNAQTRFSIILGNNQPTVNKIPVIASDDFDLWQDGKPFPINPEKTDANGDGRVLMTSGDIQSEFKDVLSFDHSDVVSEAEPIIMARLNETPGEIYRPPVVNQEIVFWSEGPGEMTITDPGRETVTKDSSNIVDSKFSSQTSSDGFKIASIPNPKKGDYKVTMDAPKSGNFYAGTEFVDNKNDGKNDSSSTISGTVEKGKPVTLIMNIDPTNVEKPTSEIAIKDETAPTVTITFPKNSVEYFNDQILPITFVASDNVSLAENLKIEMELDDELFEGNSIDLSLLTLGVSHVLRVYAYDEADNSSRSTIVFRVKKALPPVVVDPPIDNTPIVVEPVVDPVSNPDPAPAPVTLPAIFLPVSGGGNVLGTSIANPVFQTSQSTSVQKSSKKKSKHKKKKSKKKKSTMSKVVTQMKQVLGISTSKNMSQATVVSRFENYATFNATTLWNRLSKSASALRDYVFNRFKNFKYFRK